MNMFERVFVCVCAFMQLDLITDLLGTPSMEAMRTACEGARAHILRGPHKQVTSQIRTTNSYPVASQLTSHSVHICCPSSCRLLSLNLEEEITFLDTLYTNMWCDVSISIDSSIFLFRITES